MSRINIKGGKRLEGEVVLQGSKNAALPILAATLLVDGITVVKRCPDISDVSDIIWLLRYLGCKVTQNEAAVVIDSRHVSFREICCREASASRSGVFFMGAMLGRMGRAVIPYPGGCSIGARPIDIHLSSLRKMNVSIEDFYEADKEKCLYCEAERILGQKISLPFPSVGATENIIIAAVLAEGKTVIENPACEPEITALCSFLCGAGACIYRENGCICIEGVDGLGDSTYTIPGDRIVAGTYMSALMAVGGIIRIKCVNATELECPINTYRYSGCEIYYDKNDIVMIRRGRLRAVKGMETRSYPGFPTDLQPQLMVALTQAYGISTIRENIFEGRFRTASELVKMGADIKINGRNAYITGKTFLSGCPVRSYDLRGGAALVIAGLAAEGETHVEGTEYIERGYEDICRDLRSLGADVKMEWD